ncbi:glycosyltransferase [Methylophilaceae bacterium]|nr:glycosyltransferase [Methylophilaceae bacterium]
MTVADLHLDHFLWVAAGMGLVFFLIIKGHLKSSITKYQAVQKIHVGETPRLGGLIMLIGIFALVLLSGDHAISRTSLMFVIGFAPLGAITLMEDLHVPTSPIKRLIVLLISSGLILVLPEINLPDLNTPYLEWLTASPPLKMMFYALCVGSLMNGMNFIDGTNGNMSFTLGAIFLNLLFLAVVMGDAAFIRLTLVCAFPLLIFTLANYPWGKIFAGDLGAYLYAAIVGFLTVHFFGLHTELSAWNAVLVLFYPVAELVYSLSRKVANKKSPFQPDQGHLHIKLYHIFLQGTGRPLLANNLVTVMLAIFWLSPAILLPWVYTSHLLLGISVAFLSVCYLAFNLVIPSVSKK